MIQIIRVSNDKKTVEYDFYFPIPAGDNAAGITWAEAIALTNHYEIDGSNVKIRKVYRFDSVDMTNTQRLTALIALNTSLLAAAEDILQEQLNFTGYEIGGS